MFRTERFEAKTVTFEHDGSLGDHFTILSKGGLPPSYMIAGGAGGVSR